MGNIIKKPFTRIFLIFWGTVIAIAITTEVMARIQEKGTKRWLKMKLVSTAFKHGEEIPYKHTCDGKDISPALQWSEAPKGTKSFVLICDDPDAPRGTWVHWVAYNIPAEVNQFVENVPSKEKFSNGMTQGRNDFKKIGYGGPCPPGGKHRYFFKIYALNTKTKLPAGLTKAELIKAVKDYVIAKGELIGTYSR